MENISGYGPEELSHAKLAQGKRRNEVKCYCVIDLERTCEKDNPEDYILVDADTLEVVSVSFAIFVAMQSVMGRSIFNPHHSEDA